MNRNGLASIGSVLLALFAAPLAGAGGDPKGLEFFETKIRPVLAERCYKCHSGESAKPKGGLRLDSRDAARKGGDSGPAVVPGLPDESVLLQAIAQTGEVATMPPRDKLPDS